MNLIVVLAILAGLYLIIKVFWFGLNYYAYIMECKEHDKFPRAVQRPKRPKFF